MINVAKDTLLPWSRRKQRTAIMEFWDNISKVLDVITVLIVIVILFKISKKLFKNNGD